MPEGPIASIIRKKLTSGLSPVRLEIEDDSGRHAGHHHEGGVDGRAGGESHFNVTVVSAAFEGQGRLARRPGRAARRGRPRRPAAHLGR